MFGRSSKKGLSQIEIKKDENPMDREFVDECLAVMNRYRALHQVEPLKYSRELERCARDWAEHLAAIDSFTHNPNPVLNGNRLGENIASRWSSGHEPITGEQTIDQWYSEVERYDFESNSGQKTGHFTQIVWKGSKEVGVGRSQMKNGTWIVIANFFPAGNYAGENAANVFPPKDGKFGRSSRKGIAQAPSTQKTNPASTGGAAAASTTHRQVRTETSANGATKTTTTTETVKRPDGSSTVTVTEKTEGPGPVTKIKVVETVRKADGSTATQTKESTERSVPKQVQKKEISADLTGFRRDVIDRHNAFRKRHRDTGELVLNAELTAMAQSWADYLAKTKSLVHSRSVYRGQTVGENVASKHGTGHVDYSGDEVVEQWYREINKYSYASPPDSQSGMEYGHFTQVVWKDSTDIGIGKAFSDDNRVYVVVLYYPAGNYVGRANFERNVRPLK